MYTLVIPLKLGKTKSFADGSTILKYINEAADEYKVDHIYQQKAVTFNLIVRLVWTIVALTPAMKRQFTCQFILVAVGITIT
jgi:hypothetical protein